MVILSAEEKKVAFGFATGQSEQDKVILFRVTILQWHRVPTKHARYVSGQNFHQKTNFGHRLLEIISHFLITMHDPQIFLRV